MIERWSRDQVLALAPDAPSRKAAQGVARAEAWPLLGVATAAPPAAVPTVEHEALTGGGQEGPVVFGECKGSGATPYQTCVELDGPACQCGCPSRKSPCKHALGLLLLWSAGDVPAAEPPPWVADRLARRDRSAARAGAGEAARQSRQGATTGGRAGARSAATESARHARVAAGLAELERWLADQIRQGLATAGDGAWDDLAKRLVDAQAPGVASTVSRLREARAADDWPERLLEEYALIDLLAVAYRRRAHLPVPLAQTVLSRVGFPVMREEVLAGPAVRDRWDVLGRRDEVQERLTSRRVWLRGRDTGRPALVLSFAPQGQALDPSFVTGATVDADLAFYPGAAPLRALAAGATTLAAPMGEPPGVTPEEAMDEVAAALAADPWTDSWPLVLAGVVPGRTGVGGFPLHRSAYDPWRLIAVSGGRPVTVAAEWTPHGLRPLTTWAEDGTVVIL
ncbi:SWIM zinc finger family protein [Nonomuraea sp. SMC257]|uniref:SWIM zinc finger family protein n=1 Tax=Nonomuraea montanisoli TaxID=2741721 RepID=A0A7Y6M717_9ACTN|nr:SWIM zinc finger family protein [Nonomuraea montanisoli]NUW36196.1 SWIM zinc finger family protein [Nonomuraea montanisoli]